MKPTCKIEDCGSVREARGLCKKHYDAWRDNRIPGYYLTLTEYMATRVYSDNLRKPRFSEERAADMASLIRLLP